MINKDNYNCLKQELDPKGVQLIAVSKRQPIEKINALFELGHLVFGENQAQALKQRFEDFSESQIDWHFIGHLQTNKVKYIAPQVTLIHSIDSLKLLKEVNKQAIANDRIINCLFQLHIAMEDSKFGLKADELQQILDSDEFHSLQNIRIKGLMGMATYTDDETQVGNEFAFLRKTFEKIKQQYFLPNPDFMDLSMGMSDDYHIAVKEGSTMVRVGTKIFGHRTY